MIHNAISGVREAIIMHPLYGWDAFPYQYDVTLLPVFGIAWLLHL